MKKICSILLSLSLCFTFLLSTVSAAEPERSLHINLTANGNSFSSEEEFSIDLSVNDFQGVSEVVCFGPLTITYRTEAAQFLSFEPNSKFSASDFTVQEQNGKISIIYIPESSNPVSVLPEDAIGKLYFRASDVSKSMALQIQVDSAKGFADKEYHPITASAGKVSDIIVHPKLTSEANFFLQSSTLSAECQEEFSVSFKSETSKDISYFGPVSITYDPQVLEYVGYDLSKALDKEEIVLADIEGKITLIYQDKDLGQTPISGLTELLNLKFKVKDFDGVSVATTVSIAEIATVGDSEGNEIGFDITESESITIFNVYEIYNKSDLNAVRNKLDAHYRLMNNIKFTKEDFAEGGEFYNDGQGWEPIGDNNIPFTGTFDGNGHVIDGLQMCISSDSTLFVGLFGCNEGNIKNLGVINGNIRGTATSIYNVYVGGIAGHNRGTIAQCYNGNKVEGTPSQTYAYVGGISGFNQSGTVTDCINIGEVCGFATYPTASVSVGGISGDGYQQTVKNCYNIGNIHGKANYALAYVGGVLGNLGNTPGSIATNCYYLNNVEKGIGKGTDTCIQHTVDQMMQQDTFAGFDFDTVWTMEGNEDYFYPELKDVPMQFVKEIDSIKVTTPPSKLEYLEGKETLDVTGGKLKLTYNNGTTEVIDLTADMVSGFDNTKVGPQTLTVTYKGKITTFEVEIVAKSLESIEVTTLPTKTEYLEGKETLDVTGGKLKLTYNNGTSEIIDLTPDMVSGFDNTKVGPQTLTVTYKGKITTFEVEIVAKSLESIEVTTLPTKTEYLERKDALDVTGGKLKLTYNNGTTEVINLTAEMVSGFNNTKVGPQTLTVTYKGKITTFEVEIVAKSLESIEVSTLPSKLKYLEGKDALDVTGGKLKLTYNNGTSEVVDLTADMITGFDNTKVGPQALTVTYKGKITTFKVEIVAKSLESIEVSTLPSKLKYLEGKDALDVTGGKLKLTYNNGTSEVVDLTADMITGFDNTKVGPQTLTVTYKGKITTFEVEIVAKSLESIQVSTPPSKLKYLEEKDKLDVTGGTLTLTYNNGATEVINLTPDMVTGFDNTQVGLQTLTVTYKGKITTFEVEIVAKSLESIEVSTLPTKLKYLEEKDKLDVTGGTLTLTYNNGTSEVINLTADMVSGFNNTKVGSQILTVTYKGKITTFEVEIVAKSLTEIKVTKKPDKLSYLEGEAFNPAGMEVTAYYNNGTSEKITNYEVSGYTSTPGDKVITIRYKDKTTTFKVTVTAKSLTGIQITKQPNKTTYIEGTVFDSTGMELTLTYNNGTSETITSGWQEEYDFSSPGQKTVSITYGGKKTTLTVTVTAKQVTSIAIASKPNKTTYIEGQELDTTGLKLKVSYNNGTSEVVTSNWKISGYDKNRVGKRTITVTYQGKTATFEVTVTAKSLTGIRITKQPSKLTYMQGESLNTAGMELTLTFNNGTTQKVTSGFTTSDYDKNKVGKQTVTVTYQGKTATFTVTVNSRVPSSITSNVYTVSSEWISKIPAGTTISTLVNGINEKQYIKVFKGNSEVSGNTVVGTGMVVKLMDGNTVKHSVTVVVTGDTNGDGGITITDMIAVKAHVLKKSTLSGAAAKAADTNGDNGISITDFIQIKAHILGKSKIQAR